MLIVNEMTKALFFRDIVDSLFAVKVVVIRAVVYIDSYLILRCLWKCYNEDGRVSN